MSVWHVYYNTYLPLPSAEICMTYWSKEDLDPNLHFLRGIHSHFFYHKWLTRTPCNSSFKPTIQNENEHYNKSIMIVQGERENICIIAEPLTFASDDLPCCLTWVAQTIFHLSLNVVVLANIADHQLAQEFVWCFFWLFVLLINLFLEFLWHQHHSPWLRFYN